MREKNYPIQVYILAIVTVAGLMALFLAANAAFLLVSVNPWQAFFNAMLIEAGLVAESIALIRHPKNTLAYIGVTISLTVSGTYNYIQSAEKAAGAVGGFELIALAVGPLAALFFISLILGREIRAYQDEIEAKKSATEKAKADAEANRLEAEREERAWRRQLERERALAEIAAKKEAEIARAEAEKEAAIISAKQRASVEKAKLRAETRKSVPETRKSVPETNGKLPETNGNLPHLPEIRNFDHFKSLVESGEIEVNKLTGKTLHQMGAVGTERTGRNWLRRVNNNKN